MHWKKPIPSGWPARTRSSATSRKADLNHGELGDHRVKEMTTLVWESPNLLRVLCALCGVKFLSSGSRRRSRSSVRRGRVLECGVLAGLT